MFDFNEDHANQIKVILIVLWFYRRRFYFLKLTQKSSIYFNCKCVLGIFMAYDLMSFEMFASESISFFFFIRLQMQKCPFFNEIIFNTIFFWIHFPFPFAKQLAFGILLAIETLSKQSIFNEITSISMLGGTSKCWWYHIHTAKNVAIIVWWHLIKY